MPWYSLTTLGIDGKPVRREVLYRDDITKVWDFIGGRSDRRNHKPDCYGYWISEDVSDDDEWDFDFDEPKERRAKPYEVPLIFGEELKPE